MLTSVIFALAVLAGCQDNKPIAGMTPSEQQQQPLKDQLRNAEAVDKPVYWLGTRYHSAKLLSALASPPKRAVNFQYGFKPHDFSTCSGTCGSAYSVVTSSRGVYLDEFRSELSKRSCVRVIQSQIVVGCAEDETWLVLRGRKAVLISDNYEYLTEARARKMIAALKPFGEVGRENNPATTPLTEQEREGLSPRIVANLREALSHR